MAANVLPLLGSSTYAHRSHHTPVLAPLAAAATAEDGESASPVFGSQHPCRDAEANAPPSVSKWSRRVLAEDNTNRVYFDGVEYTGAYQPVFDTSADLHAPTVSVALRTSHHPDAGLSPISSRLASTNDTIRALLDRSNSLLQRSPPSGRVMSSDHIYQPGESFNLGPLADASAVVPPALAPSLQRQTSPNDDADVADDGDDARALDIRPAPIVTVADTSEIERDATASPPQRPLDTTESRIQATLDAALTSARSTQPQQDPDATLLDESSFADGNESMAQVALNESVARLKSAEARVEALLAKRRAERARAGASGPNALVPRSAARTTAANDLAMTHSQWSELDVLEPASDFPQPDHYLSARAAYLIDPNAPSHRASPLATLQETSLGACIRSEDRDYNAAGDPHNVSGAAHDAGEASFVFPAHPASSSFARSVPTAAPASIGFIRDVFDPAFEPADSAPHAAARTTIANLSHTLSPSSENMPPCGPGNVSFAASPSRVTTFDVSAPPSAIKASASVLHERAASAALDESELDGPELDNPSQALSLGALSSECSDEDAIEEDAIPPPETELPPTQLALYYLEYVAHKRRPVRALAMEHVLDVVTRTKPSFTEHVHAANSAEFASFALERIVQCIINNLERFEVDGGSSLNYSAAQILLVLGAPYIDPALPVLQVMLRNPLLNLATHEMVVNALLAAGSAGITALMELAQDEGFTGNARLLLNALAAHGPIRTHVVVPELIRMVATGPTSSRAVAVLALSKMLDAAAPAIPVLRNALLSGSVDRYLVVQALRTAGDDGEAVLIELLATARNAAVRAAAVRGLGLPRFHMASDARLVARATSLHVCVEADLASAATHAPHDPHYVYLLPPDASATTTVRADGNELPTDAEERLVVDARELVSSIRRALVRGVFDDPKPSADSARAAAQLTIDAHAAAAADAAAAAASPSVSGTVEPFVREEHTEAALVAIGHGLCDVDAGVRIAALAALATVGMPVASPLLANLQALLNDEAKAVREAAANTVGSLAPGYTAAAHLIPFLTHLLRDEFWKVRYSAAKALGKLGTAAEPALPILRDVLVAGTVTRNLAAAAMARIGDIGNMPNTQVRIAAAYGLRNMPLTSESVDYAVRDMFVAGKDPMPLVRCVVLESLALLGAASDDMIPYLTAKSLVPFLFTFLNDDAADVRRKAAHALADYGPQGELLLIEGVLKDPHPRVRSAAAYGLGILGAQSTRTLLLALNDPAPAVIRSASRALLAIGLQPIVATLAQRPPSQRDSVAVSARDVIAQDRDRPLPSAVVNLLDAIASHLDRVHTSQPW
ncbi:uncharacterized protein AMSG_02785 [Thecamonas trahens ATCC 50062]|uniref:Uncharacterized protein n=1 Tax=Thecamonas trahens ATCC 50062 TaxID=461836 RepID=A0A0L0D4V0_THETB|nr:hypothetical protein AMSG_02785 [Thecamonas trahens ATCC 50062]KNC46333.1 hypothetical protein AMSG_02785 [Thecamonas trahens ATCC 50062]|eukprot:XP_013760626.1 hypothetical protein AMSG_02785 [Thecamonas trahens ATCC 50062]